MVPVSVHLRNPTSFCRRLADLLGRMFCRVVIARATRRALSELPDDLLSDVGLTRHGVLSVTSALASGYRKPTSNTNEQTNWNVAKRDTPRSMSKGASQPGTRHCAKTQNELAAELIATAGSEMYLDGAEWALCSISS
jgi:uncharacterized protein YjiS (DUF1127 family)